MHCPTRYLPFESSCGLWTVIGVSEVVVVTGELEMSQSRPNAILSGASEVEPRPLCFQDMTCKVKENCCEKNYGRFLQNVLVSTWDILSILQGSTVERCPLIGKIPKYEQLAGPPP